MSDRGFYQGIRFAVLCGGVLVAAVALIAVGQALR